MEHKQTILNAKNVKVSFKTPSGRVHAVRGVDFDLYKGETLAIVGESGSGKSVTSKAILGILAENADIESGEIIFDGQDLLRIKEKDFVDIRGEKISMIFQDPLSSLNPIIKIGKQMTEAIVIKGEQKQYNAKVELNQKIKHLSKYMSESSQGTEQLVKFKNFVKEQYKLENAYFFSRQEVEYCIEDIKKLLIRVNANAFEHITRDLNRILRQSKLTFNNYLIKNKQAEVLKLLGELLSSVNDEKIADTDSAKAKLERLHVIFEKTLNRAIPNFFAMAYFNCYSGKPLPDMDTKDLNIYLQEYLDKEFLNSFNENAKQALIKSHNETIANKKNFVENVDKLLIDIVESNHGRKNTLVDINKMIDMVNNCIDILSNRKDSYAFAFGDSFKNAFEHYYKSKKSNLKEQSRYDKEKNKLDAKGQGFEPKPAGLIDLNDILGNIKAIANRVKQNFERDIEYGDRRNFDMATKYMVEHIKDLSKAVVHKVTKEHAKRLSIRLMEEVGITNAENRFDQYPFEFSGGMRQRIVIAIALSANPQILVCDEPTTALDVTIQSQILELINNLKEKRGLSVIFITHDLGVVANMADRVAVMYAGKIVEYGTKGDIFYNPRHPYTWALLSSMPDMDTKGALDAIPGTPPNMIYPPKGDAFAARNKYAMKIDFEEQPPMFKVGDHHYAATWLLHPQAPKVDIPQTIRERIARNQEKYGIYVQQDIVTVNQESGIVSSTIVEKSNVEQPIVTVQNGVLTGSGDSTIASNFDLTQPKEDLTTPQVLPTVDFVVQSSDILQHDLTPIDELELDPIEDIQQVVEPLFDIKEININPVNEVESTKVVESPKTYEIKTNLDQSSSITENVQSITPEQNDMLVAQDKPKNLNVNKKQSINLSRKKGSSNNNSFFNKKK